MLLNLLKEKALDNTASKHCAIWLISHKIHYIIRRNHNPKAQIFYLIRFCFYHLINIIFVIVPCLCLSQEKFSLMFQNVCWYFLVYLFISFVYCSTSPWLQSCWLNSEKSASTSVFIEVHPYLMPSLTDFILILTHRLLRKYFKMKIVLVWHETQSPLLFFFVVDLLFICLL